MRLCSPKQLGGPLLSRWDANYGRRACEWPSSEAFSGDADRGHSGRDQHKPQYHENCRKSQSLSTVFDPEAVDEMLICDSVDIEENLERNEVLDLMRELNLREPRPREGF